MAILISSRAYWLTGTTAVTIAVAATSAAGLCSDSAGAALAVTTCAALAAPGVIGCSKNRRRLLVPLAHDLHRVAAPHFREQLLEILLPHPDAAMRGGLPNRMRLVGPVNPVALLA
jgi:hypothetical protein